MESGLSGLQPEASSYLAYCLILRARQARGGGKKTVNSTQIDDYVYFLLLIEHDSSKHAAEGPVKFIQGCHSDSLLG